MSDNKKLNIDSELAEEYRQYLIEMLPQMIDALLTEHFDQAQRIAHKIKGNAPTFGYNQLAEWAEKVEKVCKEGGELDFLGLKTFIENLLERLQNGSNKT